MYGSVTGTPHATSHLVTYSQGCSCQYTYILQTDGYLCSVSFSATDLLAVLECIIPSPKTEKEQALAKPNF